MLAYLIYFLIIGIWVVMSFLAAYQTARFGNLEGKFENVYFELIMYFIVGGLIVISSFLTMLKIDWPNLISL